MATASFMDGARTETLARALDLIEVDSSSAATNFLLDVLFNNAAGDNPQQRVVREFIRRSADGPQIAGFMRVQTNVDVSEDARRIQIPTLVLHAREDATVTLEAGREMAALIPGAIFEVVPGNHMVGTGNSVETRKRILDFLAPAAK